MEDLSGDLAVSIASLFHPVPRIRLTTGGGCGGCGGGWRELPEIEGVRSYLDGCNTAVRFAVAILRLARDTALVLVYWYGLSN